LRVLAAREAAKAALFASPPADCPDRRWREATRELERFLAESWGDKAAMLDWTPEELYRVPPLWSRIDLTGAALLVGFRRVPTTSLSSRDRGRGSNFADRPRAFGMTSRLFPLFRCFLG
jgi:hypothetical protein